MLTWPASVAARLQASGGLAPVSLLELRSLAGNQYFWADADIATPALLNAYYAAPTQVTIDAEGDIHSNVVSGPGEIIPVAFLPWLVAPPVVATSGTTQTSTASCTVQNVSGNTVQRDVSQIFTRQEMIGALALFRLWQPECEYALRTFQGYVEDVDIEADGETMTLAIEGWTHWAKIPAPGCQIDPSCQLVFGSTQCGSTSGTPCNNTLGTCTSPERFMGVVLEYNGGGISYTQYAQPAPASAFNPRRQI